MSSGDDGEAAGYVVCDYGPIDVLNRKQLVELANKNRLPAMYENSPYVEDGGLMAYGPSQAENLERALHHVDKILRGTKPSELPIEQPTKFEFIVNLKTANQLGLTIPPNVLARADRADSVKFLNFRLWIGEKMHMNEKVLARSSRILLPII